MQATVYDKATWNLRERADTPSTQRHKIHQRARKRGRSGEERRRSNRKRDGHLLYVAVGFAIDNDRRDCPQHRRNVAVTNWIQRVICKRSFVHRHTVYKQPLTSDNATHRWIRRRINDRFV